MKLVKNLKRLGVVQLTSTTDPVGNYEAVEYFTSEAKKQGALMVFLPEKFNYMGTLSASVEHAQPLSGSYITKYKALAKSQKIWMSLGSIQESSKNPQKYYNSQIILNDSGDIVSVYRKLYLFNVTIDDKIIEESKYVVAGTQMSEIVQTPIGKLGMGISYDLRFPELFRTLSVAGAEILSIPGAFMEKTGYAHWEVLLRSRAIENGCFVIASSQEGRTGSGRVCYGHSLVVDPWGTTVSVSSAGQRVNIVDIDLDLIGFTRKQLPVLSHFKLL